METKIEIIDRVAKHNGQKEGSLPERTQIRFTIGTTEIEASISNDELRLCKYERDGRKESRIVAIGNSGNVLTIK